MHTLRCSGLKGTATAAPAGLTCLKDAAAGIFNARYNSRTNCLIIFGPGSHTIATRAKFLAAARSNVTPPISICSTASSTDTPCWLIV
ncbi:hypothetical protein DERP_001143 [Dermatophagoides pteronyssinus]|uniref:Uncharacterized protein n=1 Tax=Dermatophagoides pteronyssinus TaxID=6956 RepID=A0ABQ8JDM2_DERPT|nr:hypothetical protein DERP_001143 [Dermatophagoides pteronyssinus]